MYIYMYIYIYISHPFPWWNPNFFPGDLAMTTSWNGQGKRHISKFFYTEAQVKETSRVAKTTRAPAWNLGNVSRIITNMVHKVVPPR